MAEQARLFCDVGLAGRIEAAEAELIAASARAARARTGGADGFVDGIGGGVASFAGADSPFNKVAGVGFAGVPDEAEWAAVEAAFAERGAVTQVELAHLADPEIAPLLSDRGYRLEGQENVLGLDLRAVPGRVLPPGIEVRRSGAEEFDAWLAVVVEGPQYTPTPTGAAVARRVPPRDHRERGSGTEPPPAWCGTWRCATACSRVGAELTFRRRASLSSRGRRPRRSTGAGVCRPRCCRRGWSTPPSAGCEVAVITTQPGSKSQQNAQRRGFDLRHPRDPGQAPMTPADSH